ncbi:MAG: hypothetical protein RMJ35_13510 [Phycisphaerales bacterium]|nr:hypothetical protein [Phycisphaerales bacterium]
MRNLACSGVGIVLVLVVLVGEASAGEGSYPRPALYPTSWELDFSHGLPQRIVVEVPGQGGQAFWYMTYTVTNNSDREQMFLPLFELLTEDGRTVRSDQSIPAVVFERIRERERKSLLEPFYKTAGPLLIGPEQAKDGVAIWPEIQLRMGRFSIFVEGLSGETATVKLGERDVILRKTLQLNYHIRGDEVYPGEDEVNRDEPAEVWIMR